MSVRPVNFLPNGDIDVVYDEQGHTGTIPAAEVTWATDPSGENHNFITLACPDGCGATSTWPVGGGADAAMGQEMFVRKVDVEGCACGTVPARASQNAIDHVHELVTAMDGEERWALDDAAVLEALSTA
jgi:hypothetical protein